MTKMTKRTEIICSEVPFCNTFADIGCDHGYISEELFRQGKCKNIFISDISQACLNKAKKLLKAQIEQGICGYAVSDGFTCVPECEWALIAGMGGEEIIKIISSSPYKQRGLVLQPMKNFDTVRKFLVANGYKILKDYTFFDEGRFYVIITAIIGEDELSPEEVEFGRTNITELPNDFILWATKESELLQNVLKNPKVNANDRLLLEGKIERLKNYAKAN